VKRTELLYIKPYPANVENRASS